MNIVKKMLAVTAIVLASFSASAGIMNVGGVEWDPDHGNDFQGGSSIIYQQINMTTGELSGYGRLTSLNGLDHNEICPGCELSFQFGGYTPSVFDSGLTTDVEYKGGWIQFWVDISPDILTISDADLLTLENTGSDSGANLLWLELAGHVVAGSETTFIGGVDFSGTASGAGALNVTGGLAAWHFNTNTKSISNNTLADITFAGDFGTFKDGWVVNGVTLDAYDPLGTPVQYSSGNANFYGDSIPEPATLGIFALGLFALSIRARSK
jgi:hypothetical protein